MPFFRAEDKIIYFAHVPKCAGSAVELYLRQRFGAIGLIDEHFFSLPQSMQWSRSSAQHITASILDRLFPSNFYEASFAVVRHPVGRIVSEFHYLRDHLLRINPNECFSSWLSQIENAIAGNPWLYDNHLLPMSEIVPGGATVFKLEDGLDQIIPYLDALVGSSDQRLQFQKVLTRDASIQKVIPTATDIAIIERIYRHDFDRFGYALEAPLTAVSSSVALPAVAGVRVGRDALARKFIDRGLIHFKEGNILEAHANFRFALNCAANDLKVHALIANTALRLGAPYLAMDHAKKALGQMPGDLDALLALAGALLRLKNPKALEVVEALAPFEELGDFRLLLRMAVEAAEGNYEATLVDVANYTENHHQDIFAIELFSETFKALQETTDQDRYQQFMEGVGILADPEIKRPLNKPDAGQADCVDIIIPVYNSLSDTQNCLRSIRRCSSSAINSIILVDDFSSVETSTWLAQYRDCHDDVMLVRNTENLGFTRAVMAGVDRSHAPYLLLLNSDTEVTSGWLDGMLGAMCAGPQTALVGPVSNNASYQSICPASQGDSQDHRGRSPDEFAALVRTFTRRALPRVPFLSGFCLLVHRGAFNCARGLDSETFPNGYWDVQDLGLKLCNLGYDSVIADNVYVHRKGGGSIINTRHNSLMLAGKSRMFERHSALRVLVAEAMSAMEPEVARFKALLGAQEELLRFGVKQTWPHRIASVFGPEVGLRCLKYPPKSIAGQELCLFVCHCPLGAPHDYTLAYLAELKRAGLLVIVCLVVQDLAIPVTDSLMELADGVLLRENGGYDFGTWADVLRRFPQTWGAGRLYFANDSILGPFRSLKPVIESIRERNAGFFALSECTTSDLHSQSFFFGWNQANLASEALRRFWERVGNFKSKTEVILNYEFGISRLSGELSDSTQQVMFGFQEIFGCRPTDLSGVNPTHHGWKLLLTAGFPFVKTDLLRDGMANVDSNDWESVCAVQGADIEALHRSIEVSRINRLDIGKLKSSLNSDDF